MAHLPITNLFLVRHGRTDWNAEGRLQGNIERPLDDHGILQAEETAKRLSSQSLAAIYSSHMMRARQTAEIIASYHRLPVVCAYELREGTFGPIDGLKKEECYTLYADQLKERDALPPEQRFHHRLVDGSETSAEILARVLPCLQTLSKCYKDKSIAVVTHGWVMRTLFIYLSGYQVNQVQIENGAILHLKGQGDDLSIREHEGVQIEMEKKP